MIQLEHPSQEDIEEKIKSRESFLVVKMSGLKELMKYCFLIVKIIQNNHMTCRVKTKGRKVVAIPFIFLPPIWWYLGSQVAHDILTFNPDWIITRNIFTRKIRVEYCKAK